MKPSVISNGNGNGNPQPQQSQHPPAGINTGINPGIGGSNIPPHQQQDPSGYTSNVRGQFPHFSQGFGFDPDMDDMFSDSRIRSRLPRMRDPFGTFGTRKRCGFDSNFDPYSDIFEDGADDFFSGFGRRRNQNDFFEFPDEFRQYIPDGFGIPRSGSTGATRTHHVHPAYQQPNEHPINVTTTHPQYAPASPHYDNVPMPQSPKPNLCDASIQTDEDLLDGSAGIDNPVQTKSSSGPKLNKKYSQENEENRGPRSQSAPPHQNEEIPQPNLPPGQEPIYVSSATFSTSAPQNQPKYPKMKSQGSGGMPPQPPLRQQQPSSFYLHNPGQSQGQTRQWPPPPQPQSPQQTYAPEPQTPGGTVIRTIPIFVEGRKDPIYNEHKEIPGQTTPVQQQQQPPQFPQPQYQQAQNQAPQYTKPPSYQKPPYTGTPSKTSSQSTMPQAPQAPQTPQAPPSQQSFHQQPYQPFNKAHPTLDTHQVIPEAEEIPPQTPQTMDCINKIQNIQRDVLHLMEQVEAFTGFKNDKYYMYLDEMLTRNLLKLDTIDTNGKDSIRLARKEAIRCIQASINVLEAKAEENARKSGKFEVRHNSIEEEPAAEATEQTSENDKSGENPNVLNDQTVIPLPPPPEHKDERKIDSNSEIKKLNSSVNKSASQTKNDSNVKVNQDSNTSSGTNDETQNAPEKVPSKSKIPIKGGSPTKDPSNTELNREKARSQSKSPSKSPTKVGAKEGAKKKIIKKLKKLTKKDSKDGDAEENAKTTENSGIEIASVKTGDCNETTKTTEQPVTDSVSEKKE